MHEYIFGREDRPQGVGWIGRRLSRISWIIARESEKSEEEERKRYPGDLTIAFTRYAWKNSCNIRAKRRFRTRLLRGGNRSSGLQ